MTLGQDAPLSTYEEVERDPDFQALRRAFRRYVFPMTAIFLVWYFLYVLLAAYATEFMGTKVVGNITVGLLFGLGQFVSTFIITIAYRNWMDRRFDPTAERLAARIEGGDTR